MYVEYAIKNKNIWWRNAIFYETYVDKFAGDFPGMQKHLSYLETLGINCIWLLPHYSSPLVDDGYDVSDYFSIRDGLGTLRDFDNFVQAAHLKNIRVIIDLVLNHTSVQHPWFLESASSRNNSKRDYYIWSDNTDRYSMAVNPLRHLKPSNWIRNPTTGNYYFASFYPQQADLNWANPKIINEFYQVINFWLSHGVDGFRLDAVPFLWKKEGTTCTNLPEVHQILVTLHNYIQNKNSSAILIAEANGSPSEIAEYFGNGNECQLAFNFPFISKLFFSLMQKDDLVAKIFAQSYPPIPKSCQWINFLTNHDDISLRFAQENLRETLLKFLDPTGQFSFKENLTVATRLGNVFQNNQSAIQDAFNLLFDAPDAVAIYYGEELGMLNINLPSSERDLRRAVRGQFDWTLAERQLQDKNSLFWHVADKIKQRRNAV